MKEQEQIKVSAVFDYIIQVKGKYNYKQRQIFTLKNNKEVRLFLIQASENYAYLLSNTQDNVVNVNDEILECDNEDSVTTYNDFFGKIINIKNEIIFPIESKNNKLSNPIQHKFPTFGIAHNLMLVKRLNEQLHTGIISIDLLVPIGKGQRELIIGDRQTGKTHIALNTIINQAKNNVKCIYVAIGQKKETITTVYKNLEAYDVLKNTIIIDAPATSVYEQYLAPYIAMAHAENLSVDNDVLIVFDDLTKHANIIREIALLTDKPVGKEAMPGDLFFSHSSLLERAGSFVDRKTITALPILQTIDGDITSLIASNIISITDGQIVTSADLFASGKLPAINLDLSVSRTGSSVQTRNVTKIAGEVGKIYKKYKKHLKLAMLDYNFNDETSNLLYKGKMIEKLFNQKGFALYSHSFMMFMIKLISWNILKNVNDEGKAIKFLDTLINTNEDAKEIFKVLEEGKEHDDKMVKNYFLFALKQYSNFNNLDWNIDNQYEFIPFPEEYLLWISKKLGDK
ncbi:MSC_0619 family F1-like ATPase alpha subunit [Mycoplasma sp. Mirounga ES2805-ORL]|uniref:MSC_0619 family F1-like ATPase alpha subunit n=1 Tax=Mycoplasma sp. Mirounga ES2805-ORL TaxID=754514 RepID=UPI00197C18D5|nr:ATP F0F1 synthase subunit alpha [Mycoplasma sp. Mirounga ES2805-ORL]QSF13623.1 ATP F0F1 synthase subunit alpha [Mycoplasma sp. Mirounga ES2805-ORL]